MLLGLVDHLVHDPVRVLERHVAGAVCPVLVIEVARLIPYLVHPDIVEILSAREKIEGRKRVEVLAGGNHVLVVLDDIACTHIKGHLVVQE